MYVLNPEPLAAPFSPYALQKSTAGTALNPKPYPFTKKKPGGEETSACFTSGMAAARSFSQSACWTDTWASPDGLGFRLRVY